MGRKGPRHWKNGSFPPASEREARMDDPMVRSRLGRTKGTRPFGALDPKREPLFFSEWFPAQFPDRNSNRGFGMTVLRRELARQCSRSLRIVVRAALRSFASLRMTILRICPDRARGARRCSYEFST